MSTVGSFTSLKGFEAFIFDLDGCIYIGKSVIPSAPEVIKRLKELGKKVLFVTNNATEIPQDFAAKLRGLGISASADDVLTSGTATAMYLSQVYGQCNVYLVGGMALKRELRR